MQEFGKKEKYLITNTLASIPIILRGKAVLIDLRNETSVAGRIDNADGFMNIDLVEAVFIDRNNQQHPFDHFYIRERFIRQIHIPNSIDIQSELNKEMFRKSTKSNTKRTFKRKRAEERHKEILKEIEKSK